MYDVVYKDLERLEKPIDLAIVGLGFMGYGFLQYVKWLPGFRVRLLVSRDLVRSGARLRSVGLEYVVARTAAEVQRAASQGVLAVTDDYRLIGETQCDIVVEMTGDVPYAAEVAMHALQAGVHVATMNVELQATVGSQLKEMANAAGLLITDVQGDQPGSLASFIDEVKFFGFQPLMAGNLKGFLNKHATPDSLGKEAEKRGLTLKQVTSFTDGTKIAMEMSLVANYYGMTILAPGMHGYAVDNLEDILDVFDWQNLPQQGCVDYVIGRKLPAGIFVVGTHYDPVQPPYLKYLKLGDGPYYMLYRPFHLCHLEAPLSVAKMSLYGSGTIDNGIRPTTEVAAVAKRDLLPGDVVDGIGGYCAYGVIYDVDTVRREQLCPIGLIEGAVVTKPVAKDQTISLEDLDLPVNAATELYMQRAVNLSSDPSAAVEQAVL